MRRLVLFEWLGFRYLRLRTLEPIGAEATAPTDEMTSTRRQLVPAA